MAEQQVTILAKLVDEISGPGKRVSRTFGNIRKDLNKLRSAAGPLTGALSGVAASFASVAAAQNSLSLAQTQFEAETRLLAALKGRRAEFERILQVSAELQAQTRTGDEAFIDAAANLLNAGVAATDLDKNLLAAVETAAALPITFEQAQRALGRFASGRAGELGELIPQLQELQEEGRLAAEGVDFLLDRFGGAETALANTEFGTAAQQANTFGDSLEVIGNILIGLKVEFQEGLNKAVQRYVELTSSPAAKGFIKVLTQIVGLVGEFAPQIVTIGSVLAGISLVVFISPLLAITANIAILLTKITLIGVAIFNLLPASLRQRIVDFFTSLVNTIREFFVDVENGKTSFEDLYDTIVTRGRQTLIRLQTRFALPLVKIFENIAEIGSATWDAILASGGVFAVKFVKLFAVDIVEGLRAFFAENFSERIAAAVFPSETEIKAAALALDIGINQLQKNANKTTGKFAAQILEVQSQIVAETETNNAKIDQLEEELEARRTARLEARQEAKEKERQEELEAERRTAEQLALAIAEGEARAASIAAGDNLEVQERLRDQELADLDRQLDRQLISFQDYIASREELELAALQERLTRENESIAAIEASIAARRQAEGPEADVLDLVNQLVQARLRQQAIELDIADKATELQDVISENVVAQAEDLASQAEAAADSLESRRQEIAALVEAGKLSSIEALTLLEQADADFNLAVESILQMIDTLLADAPELQIVLQQIKDEIQGIKGNSEEATAQAGTFGEGLKAGFTNAAQQGANLNTLGQNIGSGFVNAIGNLSQAFVEGNVNFKEFAATFIKQIAAMVVQALVLRSILTALGIPPVPVGAKGGMVTDFGILPAFAGGGRVPGPIGANKDIITAKLMPGEHVIKKRSAQYYGYQIMEALNQALIPRELLANFAIGRSRKIGRTHFNEGGAVGMPGRPATENNKLLVADDDTAMQILSGGKNAAVRFFGDNSDDIKAALGLV